MFFRSQDSCMSQNKISDNRKKEIIPNAILGDSTVSDKD